MYLVRATVTASWRWRTLELTKVSKTDMVNRAIWLYDVVGEEHLQLLRHGIRPF